MLFGMKAESVLPIQVGSAKAEGDCVVDHRRWGRMIVPNGEWVGMGFELDRGERGALSALFSVSSVTLF